MFYNGIQLHIGFFDTNGSVNGHRKLELLPSLCEEVDELCKLQFPKGGLKKFDKEPFPAFPKVKGEGQGPECTHLVYTSQALAHFSMSSAAVAQRVFIRPSIVLPSGATCLGSIIFLNLGVYRLGRYAGRQELQRTEEELPSCLSF